MPRILLFGSKCVVQLFSVSKTFLDSYIDYEVSLGHYLHVVISVLKNFKIWVEISYLPANYVVKLLNDNEISNWDSYPVLKKRSNYSLGFMKCRTPPDSHTGPILESKGSVRRMLLGHLRV